MGDGVGAWEVVGAKEFEGLVVVGRNVGVDDGLFVGAWESK